MSESVCVGSPSVYVTDMVLFLSAVHSLPLVCVLVPTAYHTHAPAGHTAALGRLGREGRMAVLPCPPEAGDVLVKSAWIVVCRDNATLARCIRSTATVLPLAVA